jgi:hypothetical protein
MTTAGAKGCALTAFVDSWHVYLLIGNVLTYSILYLRRFDNFFINFVPTFYETASMVVMSRSESGNNFNKYQTTSFNIELW